MNIRPATAADLPAILRLLNEAGLPGDDLNSESLAQFRVLDEGQAVKGAVGLEHCGNIALLRSLVVAEDLRGHGHGSALATAAETLARQLNLASLYLLTTSADDFFRLRGYRSIPRDDVPAAIKGTSQFSTLCPSTAIVMVRP